MWNKAKWLATAASAFLLLLAAVGCAGSSTTPPAPTPTTQVSTPTSAPAPGPIPVTRLSGKVVGSDGITPVAQASVVAAGAATQSLHTTFTAADGVFILNDLAADTYSLTITTPGYETIQVNDIAVPEGQETVLKDIPIHRTSSISGKVSGADGAPLAKVTVLASTPDGAWRPRSAVKTACT
jgi:hypothetical protein